MCVMRECGIFVIFHEVSMNRIVMFFLVPQGNRRETRLLGILSFVHSTVWKVLFGKVNAVVFILFFTCSSMVFKLYNLSHFVCQQLNAVLSNIIQFLNVLLQACAKIGGSSDNYIRSV